MKILKYIFLLLLLCGIAGFVFIATQPGDYSIKKSKEISVSKVVTFDFVNNYETWHLWNSFIEANSKELFSEDSKTYTINNGNKATVYETLNQFSTDSITQKISQDQLTHNLVWKFVSTKKGTLISCEMKGTMTLKQKVFSVLQGGVQNYMGDEIQENLVNIEKYLTTELNNYNIKILGIVTKEGTLYIKQRDSSSIKLYNSVSRNRIPSLISFAKDNGINHTEKPFVLFDYWNKEKNKTKFSICLPVKEEIITSEGSDTEGGEIFEFKAVKVTLIGDYSHLRKAWDEGFKYIEKNNLIEDLTGTYIESYVVYAPKEMQPSKWVTEIYIPVKVAAAKRKANVSSTTSTEPAREPIPAASTTD
jgi:effector-binding domain-containing protein